jgi:hypothetical protein
VVLGTVVALELAYTTALGMLTAPNDDDALAYHLPRAAFWLQEHAIGYIDQGEDVRLNAFPPGGEILTAFTMATSGGDRFAALPNLVAVVVIAVGVYGIGRRIGLDPRRALFGALLTPLFPVVALHAQSTLNDLPLAALVVAATALLLRRSETDLALAAAAIALALATKVTALLALPLLAVLAVLVWRPRWRPLAVAGACSLAAGSIWYVVNLVHAGDVLGDFPGDQRGGADVTDTVGRVLRLAINTFEVPGAQGRDRFVYVVVASVVLAAGLFASLRGRWRARDAWIAAIVVSLTPALLLAGRGALRVYQKAWYELGRTDIGYVDSNRDLDDVATILTGFGPLGLVMTVAGLGLCASAVRRRELCGRAVLLAVAPLIWIVAVGVAVVYFPWNARFELAGFAVAAGTWGLVLQRRALAWAVVAVSCTVVLTSLVHYREKPSGIRLLEPNDARSAFSLERWETMTTRRGIGPVAQFLDESVPPDAHVAAWPFFFPESRDGHSAPDLLPYLLFGERLQRTVDLVRTPAEAAATGAGWSVAPSETLTETCVDGWQPVLGTSSGWTILRRTIWRC